MHYRLTMSYVQYGTWSTFWLRLCLLLYCTRMDAWHMWSTVLSCQILYIPCFVRGPKPKWFFLLPRAPRSKYALFCPVKVLYNTGIFYTLQLHKFFQISHTLTDTVTESFLLVSAFVYGSLYGKSLFLHFSWLAGHSPAPPLSLFVLVYPSSILPNNKRLDWWWQLLMQQSLRLEQTRAPEANTEMYCIVQYSPVHVYRSRW